MKKALKIAEPSQYILPSEQPIVDSISTLYLQLKQNNSWNAVLTFCHIVYEKEDDRNNNDCRLGPFP